MGLPGLGVAVIATAKLAALETRILAASLDDVLRLELLAIIDDIGLQLALLNYTAAIAGVDDLLDTVHAEAGLGMDNLWRAERDLVNDAGDIDGQANSLRFSLLRLQ
ncbi:hypothetical protein N4264_22845 [Tahibacter amnicola]|uniref:Uncharacterized protein n=1 Tax=Tahibacter amnicola TaxID=2976241 RepID=A0ABY6BE68_9GAMM|nr:DUF6689 family protein [Tahibacter amnicola]UXI67543.1 hypothetical protein N4264_22845 [Tahibacter amnicola]